MGPWNTSEFSLQGAADRAYVLNQMNLHRSKTAMDQVVSAYVGSAPDVSGYFADAVTAPAHYYAVWGANMLIAVAGIQTQEQARFIFDGYVGDRIFNAYNIGNVQFKNYATNIYNDLTFPNGDPGNVVMIGHSAGGAACFFLGEKFKALRPGVPKTRIVTFASPKTFTPNVGGGIGFFANAFYCAWASYDDAVAKIPPQVNFFNSFSDAYLSIFQRNFCSSFIPFETGKIIRADLSLADGTIPDGINVPALNDFPRWYSLIGQLPNSPHTIAVYASRLANAYALSPGVTPAPVPIIPPAPPVPATNAGIRTAANSVRSIYIANEQTQNQAVATAPENALFVTVRAGNIWSVYFGGTRVAVGPRRKTAEGMARAGNDMLRRLQRQGSVDSNALTQQFIEFIALASDPGSGIVPTLAPSV